MLTIDGRPDGAASARRARARHLCARAVRRATGSAAPCSRSFGGASRLAYEARIEEALDALADHLEAHLDLDRILAIARSRQSASASAA